MGNVFAEAGTGCDVFSMTTVTVPATSSVTAPATAAVFIFVHAMIFKTPLIRLRMGVEVVAPLANAAIVAVFASVAGAA